MTLDEAEDLYKKNNCSLFTMAREDLTKYTLYKELNIDKLLEQQWRMEVIENLVAILKETGDINIFNQIYDLSVSFHDKERLELLIENLNYIKIKDIKLSLCIAETIMGRKDLFERSGMIFWAYDIGAKVEAIILSKKVLSFLKIETNDIKTKERISRDLKKFKKLCNSLEIDLQN